MLLDWKKHISYLSRMFLGSLKIPEEHTVQGYRPCFPLKHAHGSLFPISSQSLLEGFWYSHNPYSNSPRYYSLDSRYLWHQLSTKWRPISFMPILLPLNSFLLWLGRVFLPVQHFRKQNAASDSFEVNTMHSSGIFRSTTWMTSICTNREMHTWFLLRVLSWFIHLYLTLSQENYDIHNCWKRFHVTDWTSENFIYPGWHFLNSKIKKKCHHS